MKTKIIVFLLVLASAAHVAIAQKVGEAAPDFTVSTLKHGDFTLSQQEGKVVFIFLFGDGCTFCRSIAPKTETEIYDAYNSNPDFVAIGIDTWNGSNSSVADFEAWVSYPLGVKGSSVQSLFESSYDRGLVIGRDGILAYKGNQRLQTTGEISAIKASIEAELAKGKVSSINQTNALKVDLYPNPVADLLQVRMDVDTEFGIELYDLTGRKAFEGVSKRLSGNQAFDVSHLNEGTYIYVIKTHDEVLKNGKLIVGR